MTMFHAQPYSTEYQGFYFESAEQYNDNMKRLYKLGCEEVEIQFIDGDDHLCQLASSMNISQCDIELWFDTLENMHNYETQQIIFLLGLGYSIKDALDRYIEVSIFYGTKRDYAIEIIEEIYDIPQNLLFYIDYDAIARDMEINGEITEIDYEIFITNPQEF